MESKKPHQIDLDESIDELIDLMRANPDSRDRDELALGERSLNIFLDNAYAKRLLDPTPFYSTKQKLIRDAIDDLASGAPIMMGAAMGIKVVGVENEIFVRRFGEPKPKEPVVFSVELKDAAAFADYRSRREFEMHEQTTNAAVYYLIHLLASEKSAT